MGQTARAALGDGSDWIAQQCYTTGGAAVMATMGRDHTGAAWYRTTPPGHPSTEDTNHRASGERDNSIHRQSLSLLSQLHCLVLRGYLLVLLSSIRCLWKKWPENNLMLTKWQRHTRGNQQNIPAAFQTGEGPVRDFILICTHTAYKHNTFTYATVQILGVGTILF